MPRFTHNPLRSAFTAFKTDAEELRAATAYFETAPLRSPSVASYCRPEAFLEYWGKRSATLVRSMIL